MDRETYERLKAKAKHEYDLAIDAIDLVYKLDQNNLIPVEKKPLFTKLPRRYPSKKDSKTTIVRKAIKEMPEEFKARDLFAWITINYPSMKIDTIFLSNVIYKLIKKENLLEVIPSKNRRLGNSYRRKENHQQEIKDPADDV